MIVDCHTHVFQHWSGACGHPSAAVHLKYLQKVVTRPAARTFRVRDGVEVKPAMLFRAGDNTWAGLTDVNFRVGRFGSCCSRMRARTTYPNTCRWACRNWRARPS